MKAKSILFISNGASLGGANIFLLNFLEWLKKNNNMLFRILLKSGGILASDFEALATTRLCDFTELPRKTLKSKALFYARDFLGLREPAFAKIISQLKRDNVSLIYSNTIHNEHILQVLVSHFNVPVIIHVHELGYVMSLANRNGAIEKELSLANHFVAASKSVRDNLTGNFHVDKNRITVAYGGIPQIFFVKDTVGTSIRADLKIPAKSLVVLGAGTPHWIKGNDLFLQIAMKVNKQADNDVYFIWLGGEENNLHFRSFEYDIRKCEIERNVRLIPYSTRPYDYYNISDIFLLSSREDSFPLVNLEAGALRKPVICFEKSGGSPELIQEDGGFVIPYSDTDAAAEKILYLRDNPRLLKEMGQNLHNRVKSDFTIDIASERIIRVIEKYI